MKKLFCLFAALLLGGCMSLGNKQITNDETVSQIKNGESTQSDVKTKIGEPSKITFTDNGEEIWDYTYTRSQMRAATFIPIAGALVGGTDMETQTLTIRFNKDGIVKEIGKGRMTGGGGSVFD